MHIKYRYSRYRGAPSFKVFFWKGQSCTVSNTLNLAYRNWILTTHALLQLGKCIIKSRYFFGKDSLALSLTISILPTGIGYLPRMLFFSLENV